MGAAVEKSIFVNGRDICGQGNLLQIGAAGKDRTPLRLTEDGCSASPTDRTGGIVLCERLNVAVFVRNGFAHRNDAVRHVDGFQCFAFLESAQTDSCDRIAAERIGDGQIDVAAGIRGDGGAVKRYNIGEIALGICFLSCCTAEEQTKKEQRGYEEPQKMCTHKNSFRSMAIPADTTGEIGGVMNAFL